jgi:fructose-1,6-bisphosphatase/inositol monophosphatase family enzyme
VHDWAALVPVVTGAGGVMTDWAGEALRLGSDGRVVAAGDARVAEAARAVLA